MDAEQERQETFIRQVAELVAADIIHENTEFRITHGRLAELLGLGTNPNYVDYFNALWGIQSNPLLDTLDINNRLWLVAACERALGALINAR